MNKYQGKLGMYEMEIAAERILEKYSNQENCGISIEDMENETERKGFVELLYRGWLKKEKYCYNGHFNITKKFLKRLNE